MDSGIDSGMYCLAQIAQLHQMAADVGQLQHQFLKEGQPSSADDLQRAAKSLGFKTKCSRLNAATLNPRSLPALAKAREGGHFIIARITETDAGDRCYLVQKPGHRRPEVLSSEELDSSWCGELILLTPRTNSTLGSLQPFNLSWFKPALVKYKKLFVEVVVASFFLQLFALVTPLFFQVVMDKVLVHRGFTTLNVLAVGFFVIVLF